jgi:hypothetical protein
LLVEIAAAEQRQRIAKRIKELQPEASNRQIARTLGVDHRTIDRDTDLHSSKAAGSRLRKLG